jgi:peptide/nickel transport system permease protein
MTAFDHVGGLEGPPDPPERSEPPRGRADAPVGTRGGPRVGSGASSLGRLARALGQVPLIPGVILTIVVLTAVFADALALHSPTATDLQQTFRPPAWVAGGSWSHPLGTDNLGRDVYTRMVYGSRVSLIVGFIVVFIGGTVGTALALVAGYVGRWADALIMRVTDAFFAMPFLMVAIVLAAILGPSLLNLIAVLAAVGWTRYARVIRGEVLRLKAMDFVAAAKLAGTNTPLMLWRHVLPNVMNTLLVLATLELGSTIIAAAALGFLGLGLPPTIPAWGSMLAEGRPYIASAWWIALFPGVAIAATVLGTNLLGDWLRWRLDPRYRQL